MRTIIYRHKSPKTRSWMTNGMPYATLTGFGAFILSFFSKPQVVEK